MNTGRIHRVALALTTAGLVASFAGMLQQQAEMRRSSIERLAEVPNS